MPLVLFILWNCLDRIDEENGCPQSGAALISVVLLVIPLGWYVRTSTSSLVYIYAINSKTTENKLDSSLHSINNSFQTGLSSFCGLRACIHE